MSRLIIKAIEQYHPVIQTICKFNPKIAANITTMPPADAYQDSDFHYWKTNKPILLLKQLEADFKSFLENPITLTDVVMDTVKRQMDELDAKVNADRKSINSLLLILNGSVGSEDLKRNGEVKQTVLSVVATVKKRGYKRKSDAVAA